MLDLRHLSKRNFIYPVSSLLLTTGLALASPRRNYLRLIWWAAGDQPGLGPANPPGSA